VKTVRLNLTIEVPVPDETDPKALLGKAIEAVALLGAPQACPGTVDSVVAEALEMSTAEVIQGGLAIPLGLRSGLSTWERALNALLHDADLGTEDGRALFRLDTDIVLRRAKSDALGKIATDLGGWAPLNNRARAIRTISALLISRYGADSGKKEA
jgi:hypothetical protein